MSVLAAAEERLSAIPSLSVLRDAPLAPYTRFGIGGAASVICDTNEIEAFEQALRLVRRTDVPWLVIGGGTNLIVSDRGFEGVVLRFTGSGIRRDGLLLRIESGAVLQSVVDFSIEVGLAGLQTMTGIPGYLGGALYGNAGAYGHSIQEIVEGVHIVDGDRLRTMSNDECAFSYRESIFKDQKDWIILSADLRFGEGDRNELSKIASDIRTVRDAKYPPSMKCAGSIFKNVFFRELPIHVQREIPAAVVREGKVPSAWFLEQIGAKGMRRGDIQVASYHANLIYNDGAGRAEDLVSVIDELKERVRSRFHFDLEEEVQFVGFEKAEAELQV